MKISQLLDKENISISFEVFPPKSNDTYDAVLKTTKEIALLKPAFMSVTYGAGGGTSKNTVAIASSMKEDLGIESIAHLTCVSSTKEEIRQIINELKVKNIQNVLALRGDIPKDSNYPVKENYRYAYELVNELKMTGGFCIGAACYPEGHTECQHQEDDFRHLKYKVDQGVDFLTTQMFFDNDIFYKFLYRIREKGVEVPVMPGIMPVTNSKQVKRICQLSGTNLPERFQRIVDYFGEDKEAMEQAGIAYATEQIIDLIANGVKHIHIYSMNNARIAKRIMESLSNIIK